MLNLHRVLGAAALVGLPGCVSSGGGTTTPTPPAPSGPVTVAIAGTTRQTAINSCSGDSHTFSAAAGQISIRLNATNDPNAVLSVQVCSGANESAPNCAVEQQRIAVGQTLSGLRVGAADQTLKFLPFACVFTSTLGTSPITYTASLTYQQ